MGPYGVKNPQMGPLSTENFFSSKFFFTKIVFFQKIYFFKFFFSGQWRFQGRIILRGQKNFFFLNLFSNFLFLGSGVSRGRVNWGTLSLRLRLRHAGREAAGRHPALMTNGGSSLLYPMMNMYLKSKLLMQTCIPILVWTLDHRMWMSVCDSEISRTVNGRYRKVYIKMFARVCRCVEMPWNFDSTPPKRFFRVKTPQNRPLSTENP
jgi:hypothetical protein